jgi:hypothetical protein
MLKIHLLIQGYRSDDLQYIDSFDFAVRKVQGLEILCLDEVFTKKVNRLLISQPVVMNMHCMKVLIYKERLDESGHSFFLAEVLIELNTLKRLHFCEYFSKGDEPIIL